MAALNMDKMTGGRFFLGLGTSGRLVIEDLHGEKFAKPLTRMRESLPELRERLPGVRLVLAAMGPKMCELAGSSYDGAFFNWMTPEFAAGALRISRARPLLLLVAPELVHAQRPERDADERREARQLRLDERRVVAADDRQQSSQRVLLIRVRGDVLLELVLRQVFRIERGAGGLLLRADERLIAFEAIPRTFVLDEVLVRGAVQAIGRHEKRRGHAGGREHRRRDGVIVDVAIVERDRDRPVGHVTGRDSGGKRVQCHRAMVPGQVSDVSAKDIRRDGQVVDV